MSSLDGTLSLKEVGALIGRSADWVLRRIDEHEHLEVGRSYRFTPEQAEAFVASFTVRPAHTNVGATDTTDPLRDRVTRPSRK
jgi:hypothetical protein